MAVPALAAPNVFTWKATGSPGTNANWSTAGNWTPNPTTATPPPGTNSTDVATFSGTATGFDSPDLDMTTESIGELIFASAAGGWTLNTTSTIGDPSGNILTLNATGTTAGIGINASAQTSGTTTINANLAVAANQTWEIGSGGTLLINGVISGAGSFPQFDILTISNGANGKINLTAAESYNGYLVVNSGTLQFSGNGSMQNVGSGGGSVQAGLTLNGGTLLVDNTATAVSNRLNASNGGSSSAASVTFNSGNLVYNGNASTVVTDALGDATLAGSSSSTVTVSATNGASLTFNSLNRAAGGPVMLVNGNNLGTAGGGQLLLTNAPQAIGTTTTGNADNPAVQNASIVPFLVGEVETGASGAPGASGAGGSTFGTPNTFVALTSTNGLRPLNPVDEFTDNAIVSGNNTYITSATTASATTSINSLVINGANLTIADSQTLSVASGALLFVTNNSISPVSGSVSPGVLDFGNQEGIVTVNSGKTGIVATPISGGNALTITGTGTLLLSAVSPNFTGSVTINHNTLQFGNGTAGNDGMLTNANTIVLSDLTGNSAIAFDNVTAQTLNAGIQLPQNGATTNTYIVGPGGITFNGPIVMNSGVGSPFNWLHGGYGGGPIVYNGPISQSVQGNGYFFTATNGGVTFNSSNTNEITRFYMEGVPTPVLYGTITTPTFGSTSTIPNINITIGSTGSIGAPFSGSGITATPNPSSPTFGLYVTTSNRGLTATAAVAPPPAYFIQNGPINASGGGSGNQTSSGAVYDGFYNGPTAWYVNAPLAASGFIIIDADQHLNGTTPVYGAMYVAPNVPVGMGYFSTNYQLGFAGIGMGYNGSSALDLNNSGYLNLASGSSFFNGATSATTYIGYDGSGLVDMLGSSTFSTYLAVVMNGGPAYAGVASSLNLFPGSTFSVTHGNTAPANTFLMNGSANTSDGETAVLNVIGGTVNNVNSGGSTNSGAGLGLFGAANSTTNVTVTKMPTAVVNMNSGGLLRTGLIAAQPITFTGNTGDASNFLNFGGGELDYNGAGTTSNFISAAIAGLYINSGGATIGTGFAGSTVTTTNAVTISQGLMAPPGSGVKSIALPSGPIGSGYIAPPVVVVTDSQGFDATAYATIDSTLGDANYGKITAITITDPGFNMLAPTLTFVGGGGTAPTASSYTITVGPISSGGLTKTSPGTLTLSGTYAGGNNAGTSSVLHSLTSTGADANASGYTGLGNIPAVGAGNAGAGVRNNTSTFTGPTVIEAGTLALVTAASTPVTGQTAIYPATNNNIPFSASLIVGDTSSDNAAVLDVSGIGAPGGFQLAPNQVLAGFGTVRGSNTVGLTIGAASSGNNFGGFASLGSSGGTASTISPGSTAALNTIQGTATKTATGAVTVTSGSSGSPMTTNFASGGNYYWKLDMSTGGTGATSTPGKTTAAGASVNGASWDALVVDTIAVSATPTSPFTIDVANFTSGNSGTQVTFGPTQAFSWTIARASDASLTANILADLAVNSSAVTGVPSGGSFYLTTQSDPNTAGDSDLVVNYAPAPEPTALALLAPAAGAMLLQRRRKLKAACRA